MLDTLGAHEISLNVHVHEMSVAKALLRYPWLYGILLAVHEMSVAEAA